MYETCRRVADIEMCHGNHSMSSKQRNIRMAGEKACRRYLLGLEEETKQTKWKTCAAAGHVTKHSVCRRLSLSATQEMEREIPGISKLPKKKGEQPLEVSPLNILLCSLLNSLLFSGECIMVLLLGRGRGINLELTAKPVAQTRS